LGGNFKFQCGFYIFLACEFTKFLLFVFSLLYEEFYAKMLDMDWTWEFYFFGFQSFWGQLISLTQMVNWFQNPNLIKIQWLRYSLSHDQTHPNFNLNYLVKTVNFAESLKHFIFDLYENSKLYDHGAILNKVSSLNN